jgi:hypothetical protein
LRIVVHQACPFGGPASQYAQSGPSVTPSPKIAACDSFAQRKPPREGCGLIVFQRAERTLGASDVAAAFRDLSAGLG